MNTVPQTRLGHWAGCIAGALLLGASVFIHGTDFDLEYVLTEWKME
ncbi:MAG: hypothetical protein ACREEM_27940 [Blastocatellia bacterium]